MPIPSELFCTLDFIQCILYDYVLISLPHICQHIFCLKIENLLSYPISMRQNIIHQKRNKERRKRF